MEAILPIPELSESDLTRYWAKIDRSGPCWLWTGTCAHSGHGCILIGGRSGHTYYVHRISWVIHNGPIPDGLYVLHNCPGGDNPACINPAHLYLGTKQDNSIDAHQKGQTWQSQTTHCPQGHPYEGDNLYIDPLGKRNCQACRRENERRYRIAHGKPRQCDLVAPAVTHPPSEPQRTLFDLSDPNRFAR